MKWRPIVPRNDHVLLDLSFSVCCFFYFIAVIVIKIYHTFSWDVELTHRICCNTFRVDWFRVDEDVSKYWLSNRMPDEFNKKRGSSRVGNANTVGAFKETVDKTDEWGEPVMLC